MTRKCIICGSSDRELAELADRTGYTHCKIQQACAMGAINRARAQNADMSELEPGDWMDDERRLEDYFDGAAAAIKWLRVYLGGKEYVGAGRPLADALTDLEAMRQRRLEELQ